MIVPRHTLFVLCVGLPLGAAALEVPEPAATALVVTPAPAPVAAPAEALEVRPTSVRLRETLRQPVADGQVAVKPYRLSTEERQRLRELLRGQPDQSAQNR
jgi:hypothetical protein